jgi:hypothetical protein
MTSSICKHISKLSMGKIMTMNSRSMASMANQFSFTFNVCDAFLLGKMDINYKRKNRVKNENSMMARNF